MGSSLVFPAKNSFMWPSECKERQTLNLRHPDELHSLRLAELFRLP
jgi:hypothetical protein